VTPSSGPAVFNLKAAGLFFFALRRPLIQQNIKRFAQTITSLVSLSQNMFPPVSEVGKIIVRPFVLTPVGPTDAPGIPADTTQTFFRHQIYKLVTGHFTINNWFAVIKNFSSDIDQSNMLDQPIKATGIKLNDSAETKTKPVKGMIVRTVSFAHEIQNITSLMVLTIFWKYEKPPSGESLKGWLFQNEGQKDLPIVKTPVLKRISTFLVLDFKAAF